MDAGRHKSNCKGHEIVDLKVITLYLAEHRCGLGYLSSRAAQLRASTGERPSLGDPHRRICRARRAGVVWLGGRYGIARCANWRYRLRRDARVFRLTEREVRGDSAGAFLYTAYLYRSVRHRIVRQSRGFPLLECVSEPVHGVTVESEPFRCVSEESADLGDFRRIDRLLRSSQYRRAKDEPRPSVVGDGGLEFVAVIQLSGPDSYKNVRGYSNNNQ